MIYSVLPTTHTTLPVPPKIAVIAINDKIDKTQPETTNLRNKQFTIGFKLAGCHSPLLRCCAMTPPVSLGSLMTRTRLDVTSPPQITKWR